MDPREYSFVFYAFLTAWLIYLGDRLADSATIEANGPQSLRQQFCRRHRRIWVVTLALVTGLDAYVIWRTTALETFLAGHQSYALFLAGDGISSSQV